VRNVTNWNYENAGGDILVQNNRNSDVVNLRKPGYEKVTFRANIIRKVTKS